MRTTQPSVEVIRQKQKLNMNQNLKTSFAFFKQAAIIGVQAGWLDNHSIECKHQGCR